MSVMRLHRPNVHMAEKQHRPAIYRPHPTHALHPPRPNLHCMGMGKIQMPQLQRYRQKRHRQISSTSHLPNPGVT